MFDGPEFMQICFESSLARLKMYLEVVETKIIEICLIVTNEPFNTYVILTVKDCHKPHYTTRYYWSSI